MIENLFDKLDLLKMSTWKLKMAVLELFQALCDVQTSLAKQVYSLF